MYPVPGVRNNLSAVVTDILCGEGRLTQTAPSIIESKPPIAWPNQTNRLPGDANQRLSPVEHVLRQTILAGDCPLAVAVAAQVRRVRTVVTREPSRHARPCTGVVSVAVVQGQRRSFWMAPAQAVRLQSLRLVPGRHGTAWLRCGGQVHRVHRRHPCIPTHRAPTRNVSGVAATRSATGPSIRCSIACRRLSASPPTNSRFLRNLACRSCSDIGRSRSPRASR